MNIQRSLKHWLRKFKRLSKLASEKPGRDYVHGLRVIARRFRVDFWLIQPAKRTDNIRQAYGDLKEFTKVLGEQRKYEVAVEDARFFGIETKTMKKQLKSAKKIVSTSLRHRNLKNQMAHLKLAIKDVARLPTSTFCSRIECLCRRLERSMDQVPKTIVARHRLRIDIKKTRYILETFDQPLPEIAALQDNLGRWHDLTVLSRLVGDPEDLVCAYKREWQLLEPSLGPSLSQAAMALSSLAANLRAFSGDGDNRGEQTRGSKTTLT